jgi:hypothetical protein
VPWHRRRTALADSLPHGPQLPSRMGKGDQPNFKQLIFEKKFPKGKKKIQSLILVTFNEQVIDLSMPSDYFSVF